MKVVEPQPVVDWTQDASYKRHDLEEEEDGDLLINKIVSPMSYTKVESYRWRILRLNFNIKKLRKLRFLRNFCSTYPFLLYRIF